MKNKKFQLHLKKKGNFACNWKNKKDSI